MKYIDMLALAAMIHAVGFVCGVIRGWLTRRAIDRVLDSMAELDERVREMKMRRVK